MESENLRIEPALKAEVISKSCGHWSVAGMNECFLCLLLSHRWLLKSTVAPEVVPRARTCLIGRVD